ncbi:MAG TPA: hypothetical protein VNF75_00015 [Candidatus Dormibacteraeota bacterium]|nr:hypothetical protein [Candidatus Dormibacteraeota bacterium]
MRSGDFAVEIVGLGSGWEQGADSLSVVAEGIYVGIVGHGGSSSLGLVRGGASNNAEFVRHVSQLPELGGAPAP